MVRPCQLGTEGFLKIGLRGLKSRPALASVDNPSSPATAKSVSGARAVSGEHFSCSRIALSAGARSAMMIQKFV
jgi:hypothetical protein